MAFDPSVAPLVFGEVLFDRFPDGAEVLGGAPFNVAWHLQGFDLTPVFVSRVGEDPLGRRIAAAMRDRGMTTEALQTDPRYPTGTVEVRLQGGEPSYDIVAERAYDHIDVDALPELAGRGLLYHGSLAARAPGSAAALSHLRERVSPATFVDVNLRDPWWSRARVGALLDGARWAKLNADELALLVPEGADIEQRARRLVQRHGLEILFATLGAKGAFALTRDGDIAHVAPAAQVEVVDVVGAGDGFASVLILGLLRGWLLGETLERAQTFASAIVGQRGATIAEPVFYTRFLEACAR